MAILDGIKLHFWQFGGLEFLFFDKIPLLEKFKMPKFSLYDTHILGKIKASHLRRSIFAILVSIKALTFYF